MSSHQSNAGKYDPQMRPLAGTDVPHQWHNPAQAPFRLSGFPWFDNDGLYRRMPATAAEPLPEAVDRLANCTAGGQIAFRSDSPQIAVRVTLDGLADMAHMPATGQCGFDLYVGKPGAMRFFNVTKYEHTSDAYEVALYDQPPGPVRTCIVNFPLYRGVKDVQIGLTPGASVEPPAPFALAEPIVIYGTSITQGGCASRPGMAYTNILSRALNAEVINLGFSGNGRGEPEVVRTIASIPNPALLVLDYEANCAGCDHYRNTLATNIRILRNQHENVPILVMSRIAYARDLTNAKGFAERERFRVMQADLVDSLRSAGDARVHFVDGIGLLGEDFDECTVDGVHPNDLGFMRMATGLEPAIRDLLGL